MAYKTSFQPLERLGRDGWRRMGSDEDVAGAEPVAIALPARREGKRLLIDA